MAPMFRQGALELFEDILGQAGVGAEFGKAMDDLALRGDVSLALRDVPADHADLFVAIHAATYTCAAAMASPDGTDARPTRFSG
jgi:hypothetical protein